MGSSHVCFAVDDIEAEVARLRALTGRPHSELADARNGRRRIVRRVATFTARSEPHLRGHSTETPFTRLPGTHGRRSTSISIFHQLLNLGGCGMDM